MNKEVMKQEQGEPVAFKCGDAIVHIKPPIYGNIKPKTKKWISLTEYEIKGVLGLSESWVSEDCSIPDMIGFAKAIEAKSKEKNS